MAPVTAASPATPASARRGLGAFVSFTRIGRFAVRCGSSITEVLVHIERAGGGGQCFGAGLGPE